MAISADPSEKLREHLAKTGWTYTFLSDPKAEAIRRYGLVHAGAGAAGEDIARPAEILIDPSGTVRWVELTEDYRVRARPEEVLAEFDRLAGGPPRPTPSSSRPSGP
jgi:peroxiredoxin